MEEAPPVRPRRRVVVLALVALAGCNQTFHIDEVGTTDAADLDRDRDGVDNEHDNCPDVPNTDQADLDHDGVGDACDDCLLVADHAQGDADLDGIGDACDPHPTTAGDCVVLVDTFADPGAFGAHWKIVADAGDTPNVVPAPGHVTLTPNPGHDRVAIVARDASGMVLAGPHSVQVRGSENPTVNNCGAYAATRVHDTSAYGYGCGVFGVNGTLLGALQSVGAPTSTMALFAIVPSAQVGTDMLLRLDVDEAAPSSLACRVELGVSSGAEAGGFLLTSTGGSGVLATCAPVDVAAIVLYDRLATCPPTIRR